MTGEYLNLVLIQTNLSWEKPDENMRRLEKLFSLVPSDSDLIVLPEMFSTGFSMNIAPLAEDMSGPTVRWLKATAGRMGAVIAGSLMIREQESFFNRFVFVRPDQSVDYYDKRHLFSMGKEQVCFTSGSGRTIIKVKEFRILPQVCYDLRFPVFSRNRKDYDLLLNCANWPASRKDVWITLLKARAIENQAYVAGVNRTGTDANRIRYSGNSRIVDPRGNDLSAALSGKDEILVAKLSKPSLDLFRERFPVLYDADDFDLHIE